MYSGESEVGLKKIGEMCRWISMVLLLLHFYYTCYAAFQHWELTSALSDRILHTISRTGLFATINKPKLIALCFLSLSLLGAKGKKEEKWSYTTALAYITSGLLLYFISILSLKLTAAPTTITITYGSITGAGYLLILSGGTLLSRILKLKLKGDIFNKLAESFPQEERLLTNEYSINLPARYGFRGKERKSWINIINPFRGILVMGSPGSGKSYFVIQHIIKQHLQKGFSMFLYDFKYDDLSRIVYNHYLKHKKSYKVPPSFYLIHFDDLNRSHRCNPLEPATILDLSEAAESSRTLLLGLNREWIQKQGDFFVESSINFVTALIWFLRSYEEGKYCTLPHVIELAQVEYSKLFSVLRTEPQIEVLINPFISAFLNDAREQLEGQMASAKISLAKLVSPTLYYVLSGSDFTLDINNPLAPKIVCMGGNPQKSQTYGAVLSLYTTTLTRMINKKGKHPCSLIFDEFPTLYFSGLDTLMATARSNKIATTIGVQDSSQLHLHYGKAQAAVILSLAGNMLSGGVSGESAKAVSDLFGKIQQEKESLSINSRDTSISRSRQLELALPPSKVSSLSSGEFAGIVVDTPDEKIELKTFCAQIQNNHNALQKEAAAYKALPLVRTVDEQKVMITYTQIKQDITHLIRKELERMMDTPELSGLILIK